MIQCNQCPLDKEDPCSQQWLGEAVGWQWIKGWKKPQYCEYNVLENTGWDRFPKSIRRTK